MSIMLSPILSCDDIRQSIEWYTTLGFTEKWCMKDDYENATFACVEFNRAEILLGTIDFVPDELRDTKEIGIQLYIEVPKTVALEEMYRISTDHHMEITKPIEQRT